MNEREEMYFEPRVIDGGGRIRWFGEIYSSPKMLRHIEQTVYVRDNGEWLFVYELTSDERSEEDDEIKAVFKMICKIEKHSDQFRYGKIRKNR